jgi:2-polyprenyl-3-methyl-5-hydroxy-6-metoxy-1,4-benzoquinol methylase
MNGQGLLPFALDCITAADPKLGLSRRAFVAGMDAIFHQRAEEFFRRYELFIRAQGKSLQFGVDCFVQLQHSIDRQRGRFLKTGRYESTSFEEVNRRVYADPEVMQCHMHGLVFAQFLWPDQYRRFQFFSDLLPQHAETIQRYLEIGGGHALYVTKAAQVLPARVKIDMVDISRTSLEMARGMAREPRIQYHLMNVFDFPNGNYDFITLGEVLEHVERPQELLEKLRRLLAPGGRAYITTPANAPMIDHIYLFRNAQEIRDMLTTCGLRIECEATKYAVDISESLAEGMKLPLMYAALVRNEA